LTAFLQSRRDGASEHTLKFYHTCLKRFLGHELMFQSIDEFLHNLNCRNAKHSYYRAISALCGWLCKGPLSGRGRGGIPPRNFRLRSSCISDA